MSVGAKVGKRKLVRALIKHRGKHKAAKELRIDPRRLERLVEEYKINLREITQGRKGMDAGLKQIRRDLEPILDSVTIGDICDLLEETCGQEWAEVVTVSEVRQRWEELNA